MKNPLISVIIPVYNGEKYIGHCIDCLINQTYSNIEIILINDGSIDQSLKVCREYSKKYNNMVVIDQKNSGVSSARNSGIKKATGEYISFLDVDDYFEPSFLFELINEMIKNNAQVVECRIVEVNEKYQKLFEHDMINNKYYNDEIIENFLIKKNFENYVGNKLYDAKIVKQLSFPINYKRSEDFVFLSYLYMQCQTKISIDKPLFNYLVRDDSVSHQKVSASLLDVIHAHLEIYNYYTNQNLFKLSKYVSVELCFNAMNMYCLLYNSNIDKRIEKLYYLKFIVNQHWKNTVFITKSKKKKILRFIKYKTFLMFPRLWCLINNK